MTSNFQKDKRKKEKKWTQKKLRWKEVLQCNVDLVGELVNRSNLRWVNIKVSTKVLTKALPLIPVA